MATKTAAKAPAKPRMTKTVKGPSSAASDAWDTAMASLNADDPASVTAFLNRRVGPNSSAPVTVADRAVPSGLETPEPAAGGGTGFGVRFPQSGVTTTIGGGATRQQSSRIIILAMGVAGAAIIIGGQSIPSYQVGNTKVPGNMRAFAGVIVAGTVALVLNEVSPSMGMLFGISLIFVAVADVKVFTSFGDAIFGKAQHTANAPINPQGLGPSRNPGQVVPSQPGVTPGGLGGNPPGPTGGLGGLYP